MIKEPWRIDSCGAYNVRKSVAYFFYESNFLQKQTGDSVLALLGKPLHTLISQDKEFAIFVYALSSLNNNGGDCILEDGTILDYLKVFVNRKTKLVDEIVVIHE